MPGINAFEVEGLIVEAQANGTFRAELANGHRLLAFVPGKRNTARVAVGDKVRLKLSPFDLSVGRIVVGGGDIERDGAGGA